jgi:hypothetical protein
MELNNPDNVSQIPGLHAQFAMAGTQRFQVREEKISLCEERCIAMSILEEWVVRYE